MPDTLLQIFAKQPIAGEVKTRLIPDIGPSNATAVYLHCLQHNLNLLKNTNIEYQLWLNKNGDHELFENTPYIQQGNDLGEKMLHALQSGLQQHQRVILIGSDCIEITSKHLQRVIDKLHDHDLVLIPAIDGGYVLIAASGQIDPELFSDIDWSSEKVLLQTLQKCRKTKIRTCLLNPLRDIDHAHDLQHYPELEQYLK